MKEFKTNLIFELGTILFFAYPINSQTIFGTQVSYAVDGGHFGITIDDFNLDGKPDVVATNRLSNTVSVLLGYGNGTFEAQASYAVGLGPTGIAVGDFNLDGKPDVVAANANWGQGNTVSVLQGYGNGTFEAQASYAVGLGPTGIAVGDFNLDDKPDVVTVNVGNLVSVLLGYGNGTLVDQISYAIGSQPHDVAVGDFNLDDKLDVVATNHKSASVSVLLGYGNGTFETQASYGVGNGPDGIAVGDFNLDGRPDVVTANFYDNSVSVLLGYGNGTFETQVSYGVGGGPGGIAVGDFNLDGRPDIVTANFHDNSVSVLLGYGNGTFETHISYAVGTGPVRVAVGDLNLDGKPDVVIANYRNNSVSVLLNNGNDTFGLIMSVAKTTLVGSFGILVGSFGIIASYNHYMRPPRGDGKQAQPDNQIRSNALKSYDEAILAAEEALRIDPNDQIAKDRKALALDSRGDAKSNEGDYEGALQDFEDAIKTKPSEEDLTEYRISRLSALNKLERYDDVIRSATEILDTDHITEDQKFIVLNMRGDAKYNVKDYQGALEDYNETIKICPSLTPNPNRALILEAKQAEQLLSGSASVTRGYLHGNAIEEYSVESMNTLLRLRLSQVAMVYDETPELLEARVIRDYNDVKAISYEPTVFTDGTAQVTVLPLLVPSVQEAGLMHWVGMIFERNLYSIKAFYLDSENQELHKGLAKAITGQLEASSPSLSISFEQTTVKQQSYNNCGPELIENIASHLTGVRVSQEESMQLHSLLYASYLTNENLGVEKAIAMVIQDAATVTKPYPQAESSFNIKTWLTDAAQWANGKLDSYLKPFLMAGEYCELQAIADKYKVGIEVVDQSTARQAFKKISLIVHPDKASISDAHTSLEEMHRDYLRAEELSNNKAGSALGLEIYSPVMSKLQTMHRGIRIVDSMLDTVKAIRDPNEGTISKAVIGYGYIAEDFLGRSIGMQYIAPLDIGFKVYQGDYKAAVKSCVLLAGHTLPVMLMPVAPAAAVALTGGFILGAAYDTAIEAYNELSGAYKVTNAIEE